MWYHIKKRNLRSAMFKYVNIENKLPLFNLLRISPKDPPGYHFRLLGKVWYMKVPPGDRHWQYIPVNGIVRVKDEQVVLRLNDAG